MITRSTFCRVTVITPSLPSAPADVFTWDSSQGGKLSGLLAVETDCALDRFVSGFTLHFAPEGVGTAESWARKIPQYSLVFIEMGSSAADGDDPTVMVGITGPGQEAESWAGGRPARSITIPGRGIEAVLQDARLLYAPFVNLHRGEIDAELDRAAEDRRFGELVGYPLWSQPLWNGAIDPRVALLFALRHFLSDAKTSVINLLLPEPFRVRDLLLPAGVEAREMATERGGEPRVPAEWTLFDERMTLFAATMNPMPGSVLEALHQLLDLQFHEWFIRYEGRRARIHHRVKPFKLGPPELLRRPDISPAQEGVSQFAATATLDTVRITSADVLGSQLALGAGPIFNVFFCLPGQSAFIGDVPWKNAVPPDFSGRSTDHAYLGRFGVRSLEHTSPYLATDRGGGDNATAIEQSRAMARALRDWYDPMPVMWSGAVLALGRSAFRPGQRLVWEGRDAGWNDDGRGVREFYIEGVGHRYDFRGGAWRSQLRVGRGWALRTATY